MCLPVKFLKCYVEFSAIIYILLGLVALITGIVFGVQTSGGNFNTILSASEGFSKGSFIISMCVFGASLILLGIFGYCGGKKKSKCCMLIFDIGVLIGIIPFLALAIASIAISSGIESQSNLNTCQTGSWSTQFNKIQDEAANVFCTSDCPCYIDENLFPFNYTQANNLTTTTNQNATQYSTCSQFNRQNAQSVVNYGFLSAVEYVFDCSGWCTQQPVYQFSDTNRGVPSVEKPCYFYQIDWLHLQATNVAIVTSIITFFGLMTLLATCCLCCHPEQRKDGGNYYEKMGYYDK